MTGGFLALVLIVAHLTHFQQQSGIDANSEQALSLSIEPLIKEIVPYEPLPIIVTIRNQSERSVRFDSNYFYRAVFLCRAKDEPFKWCSYSRKHGVFVDAFGRELAPKAARMREEVLFRRPLQESDEQAFVFPKPGEYWIKAETRGLESNVVQIKVRSPSAAESAAAKDFSRPPAAEFIQDFFWIPLAQRDQVAAELQQLVAKHPRSPFADYANYRLGRFFYRMKYPQTRNPLWGRDAYRHFAALSPRMPMLRMRAAWQQLYLFDTLPISERKESFFVLKKALFGVGQGDEVFDEWPQSLQKARRLLQRMEIKYVEDERLEKIIHYRFAKSKTIGETFKEVSAQSGVPLDMDPKLKERLARAATEGSCTVREFLLKRFAMFPNYWEQRGKGYYLVTEREQETQEND